MTMDDLIRGCESRVKSAQRDYEASRANLIQMRERVDSATPPSESEIREATTDHDRLSDKLDDLRAELTQLQSERLADLEIVRAQHDTTPTNVTRGGHTMNQTGKTYVVSEPSTYTEHAERDGGPSFLMDLFNAQLKADPQAGERLSRHGKEVEASGLLKRVGTTTSTTPSFVPPQYLSELFSQYARRGRPFANLLTSLPLPDRGMSLTIPKITTPSVVTTQAAQNTDIGSADMADTGIVVPVHTVGGYVPVSRQLLERGEYVESMVFSDLAAAYSQELDALVVAACLAESGTNDVTFTSSSPTVVEFWPKLADAVGQVRSLRFSGATAIVMHPRRWSWCLAALSDDDDRPLMPVSAAGPSNAMGVGLSPEYDGVAGTVLGLPVYLDSNIVTNLGAGTNQDTVYVLDARDSLLFEDASKAPAQLKFEAVAGTTLTTNLVCYGYSAWTFSRQPTSISKIGGTGLVAPGAL